MSWHPSRYKVPFFASIPSDKYPVSAVPYPKQCYFPAGIAAHSCFLVHKYAEP